MIRKLIWLKFFVLARLFPGRPRMTILLYHSISDTVDFFSVTPETFEKQMRYLKENADVVPLSRAFEHAAGNPVVRDSVAVTFDDGYADFRTNALPVLEHYNIPATVFVLTGNVKGEDLGNSLPRLGQEDLRALKDSSLVEIGSHGVSHRKMSKMESDEAFEEMKESRAAIERDCGASLRYLAYPKGSYNQMTMEKAREAGYEGAVTVVERGVVVGDDAYALPRIQVDSRTSTTIFKAKLSRAADWYLALWKLLRRK